ASLAQLLRRHRLGGVDAAVDVTHRTPRRPERRHETEGGAVEVGAALDDAPERAAEDVAAVTERGGAIGEQLASPRMPGGDGEVNAQVEPEVPPDRVQLHD